MKKKINIVYYPSLKNYIIFSDNIRLFHKIIDIVYQAPLFPKKNNSINFIFFRNLFKSNMIFKIFLFWISIGFNLLSNKSIAKECKKYKIKHKQINAISEIKLKKNQYLIASVSEIIPKEFLLKSKNILTPHEGQIPEWRGSALYVHYMISKFKYAKSTLFFTGKKLDIPETINCKSNAIEIKNNTVIDLWYKLIHASKDNVFSFLNNYFYKNKINKIKIKIKKKYKMFTFPNSKDFQDLKKNKVKFFSLDNIKKLILFNE
jgi:hypothetical protein